MLVGLPTGPDRVSTLLIFMIRSKQCDLIAKLAPVNFVTLLINSQLIKSGE
jgi:hypothetical protein